MPACIQGGRICSRGNKRRPECNDRSCNRRFLARAESAERSRDATVASRALFWSKPSSCFSAASSNSNSAGEEAKRRLTAEALAETLAGVEKVLVWRDLQVAKSLRHWRLKYLVRENAPLSRILRRSRNEDSNKGTLL